MKKLRISKGLMIVKLFVPLMLVFLISLAGAGTTQASVDCPPTYIEVIKNFTATTPGVFNLWIQKGTDAAVNYAQNVGNNGTTGKRVYYFEPNPVSFTVSETAGTNTNLANYWKTVVCKVRSTNVVVAQTPDFYSLSSLTFTVSPGQDIVCTITNKDIPTAVSIVNAKAVAGDDKVTVSWEAPFMDTHGYNVLRDGAVISELFTPNGPNSSFKFVDNNVKVGETYTYWIQTVEGEKEMLAPVTIPYLLRLPVILR